MGNRNGSSRRKQHDNAYVYADNRRNEHPSDKNGGSINRRSHQPQTSNYHQYPNGYGVNPVTQPANHHSKTNSSKNFTSISYESFFFF
jgi:hypothetical protein